MASKKSDVKETKKVVKKTTKKTTTKKAAPKKVEEKKTTKKVVKKPVKKVETKKVEKKVAPKKVEVVKEEPKVEVKQEVKKEVLTVEARRYIYFVGLLVLGFILIIAAWDIYTYYSFDAYHTSYLVNTATIKKDNVIKLNDAKEVFKKLKGNYFVYVSYTDDKEIYKLEKKIKKLVDKYKLNDKFYYINVDDEKKEKDFMNLINQYLNTEDVNIKNLPTIFYVNSEGEVTYNNVIAKEEGKLMDIGDFQKLIDINGYR